MKKLLFALLVLTGISFSQEMNATFYDEGLFVNDSLFTQYIDTVGVDDTTAAVTSQTLALHFRYDFMTLSIRDTGATYTDSVLVQYSFPGSTTWYPVHFIKDSTFSNVTQPIAAANSQHSYQIFVGDMYQIKVGLTNVQAVNNRVCRFKLQASKKRTY